ncbi:exported protein of unknown function [Streptantibioticus cattleyicolor NRRL 8057 = DSM 46488]|nr:exported protein of unknown function [Streptantibioticus cattleyicolor NRRL 8057 = DSM 46488]
MPGRRPPRRGTAPPGGAVGGGPSSPRRVAAPDTPAGPRGAPVSPARRERPWWDALRACGPQATGRAARPAPATGRRNGAGGTYLRACGPAPDTVAPHGRAVAPVPPAPGDRNGLVGRTPGVRTTPRGTQPPGRALRTGEGPPAWPRARRRPPGGTGIGRTARPEARPTGTPPAGRGPEHRPSGVPTTSRAHRAASLVPRRPVDRNDPAGRPRSPGRARAMGSSGAGA